MVSILRPGAILLCSQNNKVEMRHTQDLNQFTTKHNSLVHFLTTKTHAHLNYYPLFVYYCVAVEAPQFPLTEELKERQL